MYTNLNITKCMMTNIHVCVHKNKVKDMRPNKIYAIECRRILYPTPPPTDIKHFKWIGGGCVFLGAAKKCFFVVHASRVETLLLFIIDKEWDISARAGCGARRTHSLWWWPAPALASTRKRVHRWLIPHPHPYNHSYILFVICGRSKAYDMRNMQHAEKKLYSPSAALPTPNPPHTHIP